MTPAVEPRQAAPHFAYIDSIRGLAFLGVLSVHCAMVVGNFPLREVFLHGGYGVQLFFLASAVTLCLSWTRRKDPHPVGSFFVRRLFRIAPLFWLAILFYVAAPVPHFWPRGADTGSDHPVLTAFFVNGWNPGTFAGAVPGGWSIVVEMTFYLIFPCLICLLRGLRQAVVAAGIGVVLNSLLRAWGGPLGRHFAGVSADLVGFFEIHWFPAQLFVFLAGFATFYVLFEPGVMGRMRHPSWARAVFCCSAAGLVALFYSHGIRLTEVWVTVGLAGIIVSLSQNGMPLFLHPMLRYVGLVSYSCYLTHFAVLALILHLLQGHPPGGTIGNGVVFERGSAAGNGVTFVELLALTLAGTVLVSTVTYRLIEKPGIALGQMIIRRWNNRGN